MQPLIMTMFQCSKMLKLHLFVSSHTDTLSADIREITPPWCPADCEDSAVLSDGAKPGLHSPPQPAVPLHFLQTHDHTRPAPSIAADCPAIELSINHREVL